MSDIAAIIIAGTVLLIFIAQTTINALNNKKRFEIIADLSSIAKDKLGYSDPMEGMTETGKMYLIDEYKRGKRFRLIVNGQILQDLSISEWENLVALNGGDPDGVIEFKVSTKPAEEDNISEFPSN